jgi:hypothetical protein
LDHYLLTLSNFSSPSQGVDSIGTRPGCDAARILKAAKIKHLKNEEAEL